MIHRRIDRWKMLWSVAMISVFGGAVYMVFSGDEAGNPANATAAEHSDVPAHHDEAQQSETQAKAEGEIHNEIHDETPASAAHPTEAASETVIEKTPAGCLADNATLQDLRRQKNELEASKKEMIAKEAELKAREQALNDEMKKLAEARDDIAKIDGSRKKENEAKIAKLVETVESMNPKAASALVASLDETLAVATMARLSTLKLAKMMNVMDPSRSTKLSELMAGVVRAKRGASRSQSDDGAVATNERTHQNGRAGDPVKGGEKENGKDQQASNSNRTVNVDGNAGAGRRQPAAASGR
jgi:flagellar motility protein MotE (MotC chaperone)